MIGDGGEEWGRVRTGVVAVHDPGVVEHDVQPAPFIQSLDGGLHVGFLGNVAFHSLDDAGGVRRQFFGFGDGLSEGGLGDVGHQDRGALAEEEDGCLEADAAAYFISIV